MITLVLICASNSSLLLAIHKRSKIFEVLAIADSRKVMRVTSPFPAKNFRSSLFLRKLLQNTSVGDTVVISCEILFAYDYSRNNAIVLGDGNRLYPQTFHWLHIFCKYSSEILVSANIGCDDIINGAKKLVYFCLEIRMSKIG